MYGWDRDWTEKGESCIVVTEGREGRSRGCIREDPKEDFRKDIFRKVRLSEWRRVE